MKIIAVAILIFVFSLISPFIFASNGDTRTGGPDTRTGGETIMLDNPLGADATIADLVYKIARWLTIISAPLATLMVIVGAYQMMFAGGSPEKFETGKKTILYAIVAFAIVLFSWGLAALIKNILGVSFPSGS